MNKKLGIPYMGSKRKIAKKIVDYILMNNPNCKYVYDLFGGGASISFEFLQRSQIEKVYYNELNTGVVELLRKIIKDGVTNDFYVWIDRETFYKYKNDDTWFGGLIKTCWSFGNNQSSYLFGRNVEPYKELMHKIVVNNNCLSLLELSNKLNSDIQMLKSKKMESRRLYLCNQIKKTVKNQNLNMQLERLERLERLELSNLSYDQVQITTPINETIIYLDPPYETKTKYQYRIDYDLLSKYIKNNTYKIYLSSYEFDGLNSVLEIDHRSILSATTNNKVIEKLFCNKKEQNTLYQKEINLFEL